MTLSSSIVCKKSQSNGRAVAEPQEEATAAEELVPHQQPPPAEVQPEKMAEVTLPFTPSQATSAGSQLVTQDRVKYL